MQIKRILLEVSGCSSWDELHETIKQAFDFPEYYGKNLDALWDCLWETFVKKQQWEISICGAKQMSPELQPYMREVMAVFRQAEREFAHVKIFVTENPGGPDSET